jgi:mannosylglucosylglycerate synthase
VGGVESVLGQHGRLLVAAGHQVRIIAGRGGDADPDISFIYEPLVDSNHPRVQAAKAELDSGQIPADFDALVTDLTQIMVRSLGGVDVVIAHNVCSLHKNLALTAALRQVCARPGAPRLIAWHHDLAWTTPRYQPELYDGWPWRLIAEDWPEVRPRHVVVSELRRRELVELMGLPATAVTVVPSGLDIAAFLKLEAETEQLVRDLHLLEADPLLLLPVRITTRKNIELAIRTVAALRPLLPAATLVVTGPPGPHNPANQLYFDRLRQLRQELDLTPSAAGGTAVHFLAERVTEYLPDKVIGDLYRLADALFMPSREEGFGIPLLEAGLSGIPIFCADIPPLHEIAGDLATYFSPDADPDELAGQIAGYLNVDPVVQLRRHVRRRYTWEAIFSQRIAPLLEDKS